MTGVAAVVLAAGAATRFGSAKQARLLPRVLERLTAAPVDEVVVVEGAHRLCGESPQARRTQPLGYRRSATGASEERLCGESPRSPRVRLVRCPTWERGPGASLRCGLAALADDVEAAVVVLADGPLLSPAAVARVVERWRTTHEEVVAASYGGERGHPLLVARPTWESIPDVGLRIAYPLLVPCDDLGDPGDVDTPADLVRLDEQEGG